MPATGYRKRSTVKNALYGKMQKLSSQAIAVLESALAEGSEQSAIMVISYLLPKPKPVDNTKLEVEKALVGLTLKDTVQALIDSTLAGDVPIQTANLVLDAIIKSRNIAESTEMEDRIKALEDRQNEAVTTFTPLEIREAKST